MWVAAAQCNSVLISTKAHEHAAVPRMQGQNSTPPDVVAWIESMTPSPTPDPTFPLITDIDTAVNKTQDLLQKVTDFSASAGGFNQVKPSAA